MPETVFDRLPSEAFAIILFFLGFMGALALLIESAFTQVLISGFFAIAFLSMLIVGFMFREKYEEFFGKVNFTVQLLSYWIGFFIFFGLGVLESGGNIFSILSLFTLPQNILSSATETLSVPVQILADITLATIAESMLFLFMISFTIALFTSFIFGKKSIRELKPWQQGVTIAAIAILSGVLFFFLHFGLLASAAFFVSAMIFRTLMTVGSIGEKLFNLIPVLVLGWGFELGAHTGNNLVRTTTLSVIGKLEVLAQNFFGLVWIIIHLVLFIAFLIAVYQIISKMRKKR